MKGVKRTSSRLLSLFVSFAMSASIFSGLIPGMSLTVYAAGASYVDGSGTTQTVEATELEAATTNWTDGSWYIVPEGGLTISGRIAVGGTVNLILRDGAALTASAGIRTTGATLNIYAQSAGTGALTATGNNGGMMQGGGAGIGGNGVGGYESGGAGGTVNIYGGIVTATGGNGGDYGGGGAGIGGGGLGWRSNAGSGAGGTVNIYGGTVTATGGNKSTESLGDNSDGLGIGGGGNGRDTSTPANGTLTLGKGVKLYNGTDNTGTVLDDSDSAERSYSGSRPKNMFAEGAVISGPDKTALNDAITAAETLYNSIKDNTDYADIANTFQTAINTAKGVADSDEVDQDAVDTATSDIITANTNAVIGMINALPAASGVTMDDKAVIEAVRAAYDALDDTQKALVDADTLKKLTDAEDALEVAEVIATITALKAADAVTTADKTDIEAARAAYEALTADQKTAVDTDALAKLVACEVALAIAELPAADSVTTANKNAIEAERAAYDALTDAQKTAVGTDALAKLEACEVSLVNKIIEALPAATDVTTANKDAIEAARAAYNALTDNQKSKVSADTLKSLTDAEAALKEVTDTAAANTVSEMINALPAATDVTTANKDAIEAARKAYDELTADQKAKVSDDTLKNLKDAEDKLVIIQTLGEVSAKTGSDMAYSENAIQLIEVPETALPEGYIMMYAVTTEDKAPEDSLYTSTVPTESNAGTYYVWFKAVGGSVSVDAECVTVTIAKKDVTVTADDKSMGYGKTEPELTATVTGAVSGDTVNFTLTRAEGSEVGEYVITVTAGENPNYNVTVVNGKFTINKCGWYKEDGNWYLYDENGKKVTGFAEDEGKTYYMDETGIMQTGWVKVESSWYYFNTSGAMLTGWRQVNNNWYYLDPETGAMVTGWFEEEGEWYYLDSKSGAMARGWKDIDGRWYCFENSGVMRSGWIMGSGGWYYLAPTGAMQTGWQKVDGKWYYLASSGEMLTGWLEDGGEWYYLSSSGAMATEWQKIEGDWYWFGTNGAMVYSTSVKVNGTTYNFNDKGVCTNP